MQTPSFTIGGIPTPFGAAWAQLKERPHEPTEYEICVPRSFWSALFDPAAERAAPQSWSEFIWSQAEEYGLFVDIWLSVLSECDPSKVSHCEWVIATVDQISEYEDHIRIAGQAERFEPWRFAPVVLLPLE